MKRKAKAEIAKPEEPTRPVPGLSVKDGVLQVEVDSDDDFRELYGMKTRNAAKGVFVSALHGLGKNGEPYRDFMAAMAVEMEPTDAIEAMLISQLTVAHAAMMQASARLIDSDTIPKMEAYDRAMNRLARTFTTQVETLKRYRAKAQQVVRVERVTVEDGGQAIVGNVQGVGVMTKTSANPMQSAHNASRCTAKAKRTKKRCNAPAVRGWRVCRMHGAGGGAPRGSSHPNYQHGGRSRDAADMRTLGTLLRRMATETANILDDAWMRSP